MESADFGISTQTNEEINIRNIGIDKADSEIVHNLLEECHSLFILGKELEKENEIMNDDLLIEYNKLLEKRKYNKYFSFDISKKLDVKKPKKKSKKEMMIEKNINGKKMASIRKFIENLVIQKNHYPNSKKTNIDSTLNILFWVCYLIKNRKSSIDINIYYDACISLYRILQDNSGLFNDINNLKLYNLMESFENMVRKKSEDIYDIIMNKNFELTLNSFYDLNKPNSISLYNEQKELIQVILDALDKNEKKLIFYWVPPANGKTLISSLLTRMISSRKNKKVLLYICYNDIVRDSVASLCLSNRLNVKFWFANYISDKWENGEKYVKFNPYKNCYPDWRKRMPKNIFDNDKFRYLRYSHNVEQQFLRYCDETRRHSQRTHPIETMENCDNFPEMIISDLESAKHILQTFGDLMIPYFDEAFALSNEKTTADILKNFSSVSVLVSSTLADKNEIPNILNHFKEKHGIAKEDDTYLHYIKSTVQHINCEFISDSGDIIPPHYGIQDEAHFNKYLTNLLDTPILQRGYSHKIVYKMSQLLDKHLPKDLRCINRFKFIGMINSHSVREYGIEMLKFIQNNFVHWELINNMAIPYIQNNLTQNMFTSNSYILNQESLLNVGVNLDIEGLTSELLEGSPKLKNCISSYEKEHEKLSGVLEKTIQNNQKDLQGIYKLQEELSNLKMKYPMEYIINSIDHSRKFSGANKPFHFNYGPNFDLEVIKGLTEIEAKLFLSYIGYYHSNLSHDEKNTFMFYKNKFNYIFSDPSITYGTNINLTMIEMNEDLVPISTKSTIYQLIGRTGRRGKSKSSKIILRNNEFLNILVNQDYNKEAMDIEKFYVSE